VKHILPDLPYAKDALVPHLSAETLDLHHGKHHRAYVDKLNELIVGTKHAEQLLEEIIMSSEGEVFNNAAQHWNHSFYWHCLTPAGEGYPVGQIASLIHQRWGSFEKFQAEFNEQAIANFGSGWTWLVRRQGGELAILNTSDADTPMTSGMGPLLTVDVWEHAYYVDYRNERSRYLDNFWDLVDWGFVNRCLTSSHELAGWRAQPPFSSAGIALHFSS
jgi:Fe-Mn family superoxide dismutase